VTDHEQLHEDIGAYLLGALDDGEHGTFEAHLAECTECREQIAALRPAADALPRSAPPMAPPPALRRSLMETVEREAREARRAAPAPPLAERLRGLLPTLPSLRHTAAWVSAAFLLAVGIAAGLGLSRTVLEEAGHTVAAKPDRDRVPLASGTIKVFDGEDGAIVRLHGMPRLDDRHVYQAWVQRGGEIAPQPTFDVGPDGTAQGAISDDLESADAVFVTREPRGGARAPSEEPLLRFKL